MATLNNVQSELRQRVEWMVRAEPRLWVNSAWRNPVEQQALWNRWQWALKTYGAAHAREHAALAARPGSSKHERTPAEAVDVAAPGGLESRRAALARQCGLHTPVPGELWHMELAPNRSAIPAPVRGPANEREEAMEKIPGAVDAALIPGWHATDGRPGVWVVKDDGGVWTYPDGAPFHGSMGGKTINAPMAGIVAHGPNGYWLIGSDGGIFAFGDAPGLIPYPKFFEEHAIGQHSMVDAEFDGDTLTLLADDGAFYTYTVPK
jgi:hypothetical protein